MRDKSAREWQESREFETGGCWSEQVVSSKSSDELLELSEINGQKSVPDATDLRENGQRIVSTGGLS